MGHALGQNNTCFLCSITGYRYYNFLYVFSQLGAASERARRWSRRRDYSGRLTVRDSGEGGNHGRFWGLLLERFHY